MKPAHVGVIALFLLFVAAFIASIEWLRPEPIRIGTSEVPASEAPFLW